MKILLADDGSRFGDAAVKEVLRRPWPAGSEVKVVSVIEPPPAPAPAAWAFSIEDYKKEAVELKRARARKTIEAAERILDTREDKTLKVTTEILEGSPKQTLLEEAEAWGADLIVVGSHGYGFWDRLLLGSVSNAVASRAKCSVEIVRQREDTEGEKG